MIGSIIARMYLEEISIQLGISKIKKYLDFLGMDSALHQITMTTNSIVVDSLGNTRLMVVNVEFVVTLGIQNR